MKPARFAYRRARSVGEALEWLALEPDDSKVLAGGQSLVPLMNMRLARPALLVDINALGELRSIEGRRDDQGVRLGAIVRHTDVVRSPVVRDRAPLLAAAARHIGEISIRNFGTLGGSLAHADPAAELPAALVALGGKVVVVSQSDDRRTIAADDLFAGPFVTSLQPAELLVEVHVPDQRGVLWGFAEVARRPGDFAMAGVAGTLRQHDGVCAAARLVAFGVGDRPLRLRAAEDLLVGRTVDMGLARQAGEAAAANVASPPEDIHASSAYRQHLVAVLTEDVINQAGQRRGA